MIKLDIINEVVNRTGITKTKAEMAVETVFESMKHALAQGERIELRGFGIFNVRPTKDGHRTKSSHWRGGGDSSWEGCSLQAGQRASAIAVVALGVPPTPVSADAAVYNGSGGSRLAFNFDQNRPTYVEDLWLAITSVAQPDSLLAGLPFSLTLLTILLAHEMGHYLTCRYYGIDASLPYFLPAPTLIGTFGAFIRIRSAIPTRRQLFDVGIAGPLAGFAVRDSGSGDRPGLFQNHSRYWRRKAISFSVPRA